MTPEGFEEAAARVAGVFDRHVARMARLREAVLRLAASGDLTEARMQGAREDLSAWLAEGDAAVGYGFIAAPGVVEGRQRYLFWLQRDERGVRRLQLNLDPDDVDLYDYLHMDWYARPEQERRPAIQGPYVDYTGSNQFVLTCALPVEVEGRFLGVAGADLLFARLEAELVPVLRRVAAGVVLVNENRQAVMSNSPRWLPGDRLRAHPLLDPEPFRAVVDVLPGAGWALAALEEPDRGRS